jgi:O-antigen/teichoic acid export membrane protein
MAAIAVTCVAAMLTYALNSVHEFRMQTPLIAAVILSNVACCWALIPLYGLSGAGMAGVISGMLQIAGAIVLLARAVRRERAARRRER